MDKDALLTCFSVTGYSGGGKKMIAEYESEDRDPLLSAPRQYGIAQTHKHLPEMTAVCGLENPPMFSPIVADFYSGMEVTVPLFKSQINGTAEDIKKLYKDKYNSSVVRYKEDFDEGGFVSANRLTGKDSMEISVSGNEDRILLVSRYDNLGKGAMEISVSGNEDRILLVSRYDNLGKGASGAAVECMNIVMGTDKTKGLIL